MQDILLSMSSKVKQMWKEKESTWSRHQTNCLSTSKFMPIPQSISEPEEDEEDARGGGAKSSANAQHSHPLHDSFIEDMLHNIGGDALPGQALHKSSIASHAHYSKAHLLSTKQLLGLTFFAVSGGPFGLQEPMALGGPMLMLIGFWFIPFLWCIPMAIMTAEMACMIPESGGHVLWVYRAFGPFWSYVNGFFAFACSVLDNALYPSLFVEYLLVLLPTTPSGSPPLNYGWSVFIKMLLVILVTIINILGIDVVGNVSLVLAFMVLGPFVVMCVAGFKHINYSWVEDSISNEVNRGHFLATLLWNTSGIDVIGTCASEVLTPSHSYPKAMKFSLLLLTGVFTIPTLIGVSIVPKQQHWNTGTYVHVAKVVGGKYLEGWMGLAALFSALGLLLTRLCTNSRILYGMAQVQQMPISFTLLHPNFATPWMAILTSSLCTIFFNFFNVYHLAEANMLFYALSTFLKFGALVQLRYIEPDVLRPFQIPFDKELLTIISCLPISMCVIMLFYAPPRSQGIALIGTTMAVFSYIFKELCEQRGIKEATKNRLASIQKNLGKMQARIDFVIDSELKTLQNLSSYVRSHHNSTSQT